MNVTTEELAMMLGAKDIEIFFLQKQIAELQKRIAELTQATQPLKAVQ